MTPPAAQRAGTRNRHRAVAGHLASLFDQHASMVLGLCRLLLRNHHEAEDAAQQTFVSAYRSLLRGNEPRDAAPWLAAIARNECRARIRKRMRAPLALEHELEDLADPADLVDESERRAELAALTAAIADLPSRQREAVALRDFLGLSYEEVASTLSVSVPVVESLLFRARRRLRDTVRTVPRYAAGLVVVPFAIRAAVSRELPELDSQSAAGAAGISGAAAAGVLAKIISLPFAAKAATAVTVVAVATAGPQLPKMFDGEQGASPAALSALHDPSGQPAASLEDPPSKPPFEAVSAPPSQPAPATDAADVGHAQVSSAPPEVQVDAEEPPATEEPALDPVREILNTSPSVPGPALDPVSTPAESPPVLGEPAPEPPAPQPVPTPADPLAEPPVAGGGSSGPELPPFGDDGTEPGTDEPNAPADPTGPCPLPAGEATEPEAESPAAPAEPIGACPAVEDEGAEPQPEPAEPEPESQEAPAGPAEPTEAAEPPSP